MKIVLLGHLHGFGGAEKSIVLLANQLAERGHDVTLISMTSDNNVYQMSEKVKYHFMDDKSKNKITTVMKRYMLLDKFFKNTKADVVISFWFQLGVIGMLLSKKYDFKIIYSERGDPTDKEYDGINGLIRKITFPFFDGFVFQTKGARDCFDKKIADKSCVIHNAITIDKAALHIPDKKDKTIVGVGRLHRQKNFPMLIKAFSLIADKYSDYKLIIYGDGELREQLNELIMKLNLQNRVVLYGNTKDIYNKLLNAEIFVLSSDFEGMPNALMEAMALGLPCISTDCSPGGAAELIDNYENGILVKIGDYKDLAAKIDEVLTDEKLKNKLSINGQNILHTHSLAEIYNKWDAYIKDMK